MKPKLPIPQQYNVIFTYLSYLVRFSRAFCHISYVYYIHRVLIILKLLYYYYVFFKWLLNWVRVIIINLLNICTYEDKQLVPTYTYFCTKIHKKRKHCQSFYNAYFQTHLLPANFVFFIAPNLHVIEHIKSANCVDSERPSNKNKMRRNWNR